ncbi:unnamed protein product, partial [Ixodes pacificus]
MTFGAVRSCARNASTKRPFWRSPRRAPASCSLRPTTSCRTQTLSSTRWTFSRMTPSRTLSCFKRFFKSSGTGTLRATTPSERSSPTKTDNSLCSPTSTTSTCSTSA